MSRTINTEKRKIVADHVKKNTNDNLVIPDNVTKSEKRKTRSKI